MAFNLRNRNFLKELDLTPDELRFLLRLAAALKVARYAGYERPRLLGKSLALISAQPSSRTRSALGVAAQEQGAHLTYLDPAGPPMGRTESTKDTARVLGRMYDGIGCHGFAQEALEVVARYAGVPVWNASSDEFHPTQALADVLTMTEKADKPLHEVSVCYLGDAGTSAGNSLLVTAAKLGMDIRICAPEPMWPQPDLVNICRMIAADSGARFTLTEAVDAGVFGVDFLYTDAWVAMGEEQSDWGDRIDLLRPYRITADVVRRTGNRRVRFMHRLPSFHSRETAMGEHILKAYGLDGLEVTDEVFESDRSVVFDQAENGVHASKAVVLATLGD
jgi:ornithine carbamoyltransferase